MTMALMNQPKLWKRACLQRIGDLQQSFGENNYLGIVTFDSVFLVDLHFAVQDAILP